VIEPSLHFFRYGSDVSRTPGLGAREIRVALGELGVLAVTMVSTAGFPVPSAVTCFGLAYGWASAFSTVWPMSPPASPPRDRLSHAGSSSRFSALRTAAACRAVGLDGSSNLGGVEVSAGSAGGDAACA